MSENLGIIFSLIAMFGFGISNSLAKIPSEKFPYQKIIFYRNLFSSAVLLIGMLLFFPNPNLDAKYIAFTLILSIVGYFSLKFFFQALKVGKAGLVSPIANSSTLITVLLSIIFFRESLNYAQYIMVSLLIIGILFSSINFRDFKNSHLFNLQSGLPYTLVTCVSWGLLFFLFKFPVTIIGPIFTSFLIEFGAAILSFNNFRSVKSTIIKAKDLWIIFLVAFFASIGSLFYNLGINVGDVSIVSAITFSSPLIVILWGKFIYKEKLSLIQYCALTMIIFGVVGLSLFGN